MQDFREGFARGVHGEIRSGAGVEVEILGAGSRDGGEDDDRAGLAGEVLAGFGRATGVGGDDDIGGLRNRGLVVIKDCPVVDGVAEETFEGVTQGFAVNPDLDVRGFHSTRVTLVKWGWQGLWSQ